jgi:hypothetical protein
VEAQRIARRFFSADRLSQAKGLAAWMRHNCDAARVTEITWRVDRVGTPFALVNVIAFAGAVLLR